MYLKSLKYLSGALLLLAGGAAWSDCACFCVSGELQTMCSTVEEAQSDVSSCAAQAARACPEESYTPASASYDAPEDGAVNCRDVRVFDALRGQFVDVRACDVL